MYGKKHYLTQIVLRTELRYCLRKACMRNALWIYNFNT